uniref:Uncharacterized protein n=1 Tax=Noctiluca scintillans TaxID=2966 RepID=A0A7S1AIW2_NOCSC|mmetsp:Transcript_48183/g.127600  ORF Transcript_48183/g.127600 Transcript_48183/m.127600 type:complete len:227 (+) Transcript_48183:54-734(+)|eukprot:CAMPEP_0194494076 /NCGR_PEP_ID=MMETSP0253-20130528/12094_1 /TAXON_ID=2966 /ORGANISM="Noctiluca scintillans" /LENGTH=226 /DNA_ID=CAMNT_0039335137 /DNA_START=51 /DNA_END=731 /DNA_ORIENTATION=-
MALRKKDESFSLWGKTEQKFERAEFKDLEDGDENASKGNGKEEASKAGRDISGEAPTVKDAAEPKDHQEAALANDEPVARRIFPAKSAVPQDLVFVVPRDFVPGELITVEGPHGPCCVPLPLDIQPGQWCSVRLGPNPTHTLVVPEGARRGQSVYFMGPDGQVEVTIPPGKKPGDTFDVIPPAMMVQVPDGAVPGDQLSFMTSQGEQLLTVVPENHHPGQYFAAAL